VRTAFVLAALSLVAAFPARAKDTTGLADKIETDLEAWDIEGARRGLDELLHEDRSSAVASFLQGRVLFEQGDLEGRGHFEKGFREKRPEK